MFEFTLSSWRVGLRARSFYAVLIFGLLLVAVAFLSGNFSPRQPKTIALDVGLSVTRFALVLFSLFWVQELIGKEIDRRAIIFSVAYPVSRASYLIGRFLGIQMLSLLAAAIFALLLLIAVLAAGGGYEQQFAVHLGLPFWISIGGIWLDVLVVTAFAIFIASVSTTSLLPLALGAAFAVAGRAFGPIRDYVAQGADGDARLAGSFDPLLTAVGYVLPDLSRLDFRVWAMYGMAPEVDAVLWSVAMAGAYAAMMLLLAVVTFSRRQFS